MVQQANNQPQPFGGGAQPLDQTGPFAQFPPFAVPQAYGQAYGQPAAGPYGQPLAQPYGQPTVQPYGQPLAQPYGQPLAQPYGLPLPQPLPQPGAQPYAQPYSQQPLPYAQAPAQQAAPVTPVAAPGFVPGVGGAGAAPQQPQNPYARQLVPIARSLEQALPGYQILMSVLAGLIGSPRAESLSGLLAVVDLLKELSHQHFCALGAIRRMLSGELSGEAMMSLARAVRRLEQIHTQLRPEMERLIMAASPELRSPLSNLNQALNNAAALVGQAGPAVQTVVGPQTWEKAGS